WMYEVSFNVKFINSSLKRSERSQRVSQTWTVSAHAKVEVSRCGSASIDSKTIYKYISRIRWNRNGKFGQMAVQDQRIL
ncbi:hypothetical protein RUM43_004541, partial [Polyplax serrata]